METLIEFTATYEKRTLILNPFTKVFTPWQITMCDEVWTVNKIKTFSATPKYYSEHRTFESAYNTAKTL